MTKVLDFGQQLGEYEHQEEARRRQFIERMETKLRFKETSYRHHYNRLSRLINPLSF